MRLHSNLKEMLLLFICCTEKNITKFHFAANKIMVQKENLLTSILTLWNLHTKYKLSVTVREMELIRGFQWLK